MADAASVQAARYSAFISYSHADIPYACWPQRRLETYRLPRRLGRGTRLEPVFLDLSEMRAAPDLGNELRAALSASDALIVVCSPAATASSWVVREIEAFRQLHGDSRILAALFEGEARGSFPAGLVHDGGREPLAAEFRPGAPSRRLGLLKLVACLADVPLDALLQRDAHRRVRRLAIVATAAVLLAAAMAALAIVATRARATAEVQREKAEGLVEFMLTDLRKRMKGVGKLELLTAVNKRAIAYYDGMDLARLPADSLERRAALLHAMGEDDEKRGNLVQATREWEEARRTTAALLAAAPDDAKRIFAHSQSEYWAGFAAWRSGDLPAAKAAFLAYARLTDQLRRLQPDNLDYAMEQGYAFSNLGMFTLRPLGQPAAARRQFQTSLAAFNGAAARQPRNVDTQIQIADAYGWLGDSDRLQGRFDDALANRGRQRAILTALLANDPNISS